MHAVGGEQHYYSFWAQPPISVLGRRSENLAAFEFKPCDCKANNREAAARQRRADLCNAVSPRATFVSLRRVREAPGELNR
jgi:hypothetical protein